MSFATHPAFEPIRQQHIDALSTTIYEFRHKATGAIHYHLANDNPENVFLVAFRTQPMDSKGEAHILEHTALCGSQKYPVRDPFFSMIKRSLNSFMNAFTAADWTAYPFATQNKKDFNNLLSVYLDAAFFANLNELDFMQEGIRIEFENDQPVFKGVVFNEMKGACSAASDQLYHALAKHLYPTTTYHYNSGGEPADIPDLTYQELVDFYQSHYHPSNAILMTFGDADIQQLHEQFEQLALGRFEKGQTLHSVPEQRLAQPIRMTEPYTMDEEDTRQKTYHLLSWLLPQTSDTQLRLAMRLIEGILLEDSASPLRHYLETSQLGKSTGPFMGVDDSHYEMVFYCGIQGSEATVADEFEQGVLNILNQVAAAPIDANQIDAILHQIELHQREIGGDGMPYGLSLILNGLGSAIHHADPIEVWDIDQALLDIRERLKDPMYLSNLIRQYLIDNPHRVRLTLVPDTTLSAKKQAAEQARLDDLKDNLSAEQIHDISSKIEQLKQRQATPDDLEQLPKVTREDIPAQLKYIDSQQEHIFINGQGYSLALYHVGTNGLYYQQVLLHLPPDVANSPYLSIFCLLFGEVGAGEMDYLSLQTAQTATTGGIGMSSSVRAHTQQRDEISAFLVLTTKALTRYTEAIPLLRKALFEMRFDEKQRIIELLQQRQTSWQAKITGSGHAYAMQTASSRSNAFAHRDYQLNGLPALYWLNQLIDNIQLNEAYYNEFIIQLTQLHQRVCQANPSFLLVCEAAHSDDLMLTLQKTWSVQDNAKDLPFLEYLTLAAPLVDTAWLVQTNVQFCACSYPAVAVDHLDAAAFMVLGSFLRNGFLHTAIREQGGAYGGGAGYDGNSCSFRLFSYRDPRLAETFIDFNRAIDWLLEHQHAPYQLEESVLGLIASMDKPGSPAGEAIGQHYNALHGRTHAFRQALRQRILEVTIEDLQRITATYLKADAPYRAVVAPFSREQELVEMGFSIQKIA